MVGPDDMDGLVNRTSPDRRTGQQPMGSDQLVDAAGRVDLAVGEDDQLVADPLEVRDQVRGRSTAVPSATTASINS